MTKYVVEYELPRSHRVQVGIEAESPAEAEEYAQAFFDEGTLWDDTPDCRLLYDDYEEVDDGPVLEFSAHEVEEWPEPAPSVRFWQAREKALQACRALVEAYRAGEEQGGSIDWSDLDEAHRLAVSALAVEGNAAESAVASNTASRVLVIVDKGQAEYRSAGDVEVLVFDRDAFDMGEEFEIPPEFDALAPEWMQDLVRQRRKIAEPSVVGPSISERAQDPRDSVALMQEAWVELIAERR